MPPPVNPYAWLKADAGAYKDAGSTLCANGDTVQQWNDSGSYAKNASQATSGARPTYVTNSQNGLPILRFDGIDDFLAWNGIAAQFGGDTPFTIIMAMKKATASVNVCFTASNSGLDGSYSYLRIRNSSAGNATNYAHDATGGVTVNDSVDFGGSFGIVAATFAGDLVTNALGLFTNGNAGTMSASGGGSATTYDRATIGTLVRPSNPTGILFDAIDVGEILVYDRYLTMAEMASALQYLNRWAPTGPSLSAPTGLGYASTAGATAKCIPLGWTAATGAGYYTVRRSAVGANSWTTIGTTLSTIFVDITAGLLSSWDYAVQANCNVGAVASSWSSTFTGSTTGGAFDPLTVGTPVRWSRADWLGMANGSILAYTNARGSTDFSGNANDFKTPTFPVTARSPVLNTNQQNGLPAIAFTPDSDHQIACDTLASTFQGTATPFTFAVVAKFGTLNNTDSGQTLLMMACVSRVTGTSGLTGGTGYADGTYTLGISGGNPVTAARGRYTCSGGAVTAITIEDGGGVYEDAPTLSFPHGGGSGASATAVINNLQPPTIDIFFRCLSGNVMYNRRSTAGGTDIFGWQTAGADANYHSFILRSDGNNATLLIDGVIQWTISQPVGSLTLDSLTYGCHRRVDVQDVHFKGLWSEDVIYPIALSDANCVNLANYFRPIWALPAASSLAFDPSQVTAAYGWYREDSWNYQTDGATITGTGTKIGWGSKINVKDITFDLLAVGSPVYSTSLQNSLGGITLDGSTQYFYHDATHAYTHTSNIPANYVNWTGSVTPSWSIGGVFKCTDLTSTRTLLSFANSANATTEFSLSLSSSVYTVKRRGDSGGATSVTGGTPDTNAHAFFLSYNGQTGNVTLTIDNVVVIDAQSVGNAQASVDTMAFGALKQSSVSQFYKGTMLEMAFFGKFVGADEARQNTVYFQRRWATPALPPLPTNKPSELSNRFSVAGSGMSVSDTYRL